MAERARSSNFSSNWTKNESRARYIRVTEAPKSGPVYKFEFTTYKPRLNLKDENVLIPCVAVAIGLLLLNLIIRFVYQCMRHKRNLLPPPTDLTPAQSPIPAYRQVSLEGQCESSAPAPVWVLNEARAPLTVEMPPSPETPPPTYERAVQLLDQPPKYEDCVRFHGYFDV